MALQIANTYQAAIQLINSKQGAVFELTKDGGIREQSGFEKFKLFASKFVRSYELKRDSKDAAVAKILSQLHQRDGQSSIDPLHNATTKRFFDAQRRIDQRTAKRSDQVRQDNTNLDRLRNQSTKKEIKSVELNKALALDRLVATQETAPISAKKTLADYKDIAPRGIISDEAFQHYDPYKVKRNKIYTEKEFSQIRREDEELSKLVFDVHKKYSADPESITPEEYKWLFPDEKILCRDQRFSHYTPARIQKAN